MKKVQLVFLLVAALMVSACTKDEVGRLAYSVSLDRVGNAETVTITVGDSGIEVTADVTQATELSGVLEDVPAGTYLVVAAAYAAGASQASAEASASVSIAEDAAAVVALILGSDTIGSIVASNTTPHVGEVVTLTAELEDGSTPDLIWTDDCSGDFQQNVSAEVNWSAAAAGDCNVSVQVASSGVSAATLALQVGLAPGTSILLAGTGECIGHSYDNYGYDDGATRVVDQVWHANGYYLKETGVDATSIGFDRLVGVDLDSEGRAVFADRNGGRIVRIEKDGTLTRLAGSERPYDNSGNSSGPATLATDVYYPFAINISDATDDIYFIEGWGNKAKRIIAADGTIETLIGQPGSCCSDYNGSGADASTIYLNYYPTAIAVDSNGDVYTGTSYWNSDSWRNLYRIYAAGNTVHTVSPSGIETWDFQLHGDDIYISSRFDHTIAKISKAGTNFEILAGESHRPGFDGDGGSGLRALLNNPRGLWVDSDGVVFFSDSGNSRIRKIAADGSISTVAENVNVADLVMDASGNFVVTGRDTCSVHKIIGPF